MVLQKNRLHRLLERGTIDVAKGQLENSNYNETILKNAQPK